MFPIAGCFRCLKIFEKLFLAEPIAKANGKAIGKPNGKRKGK